MVNGAAGAVGSLVGQIAKIKGCNAVGMLEYYTAYHEFANKNEDCAVSTACMASYTTHALMY